jgi:probable phosphoglycerate mutase
MFHERVVTGIDAMYARHPDEVVAVFCHSGVIARYTAALLELPWEQTGFFFPFYTSISRTTGSEAGRMIVTVNETPHLRHTDLPTGALF